MKKRKMLRSLPTVALSWDVFSFRPSTTSSTYLLLFSIAFPNPIECQTEGNGQRKRRKSSQIARVLWNDITFWRRPSLTLDLYYISTVLLSIFTQDDDTNSRRRVSLWGGRIWQFKISRDGGPTSVNHPSESISLALLSFCTCHKLGEREEGTTWKIESSLFKATERKKKKLLDRITDDTQIDKGSRSLEKGRSRKRSLWRNYPSRCHAGGPNVCRRPDIEYKSIDFFHTYTHTEKSQNGKKRLLPFNWDIQSAFKRRIDGRENRSGWWAFAGWFEKFTLTQDFFFLTFSKWAGSMSSTKSDIESQTQERTRASTSVARVESHNRWPSSISYVLVTSCIYKYI